MKPNLPLRF